MESCMPVVERAMRGEAEAFSELFETYHPRICRYLCALVRDADWAEDLAQQTFLKAYRALSRGAPPANPRAWLYTIATRTAISGLRRRRLMAWWPAGLVAHSTVPGQEALTGERDLLDRALARLTGADAACLLLRFQHELPYAELAQILGLSVPAARMRLSRARAAFREAYLQLEQEANR
jgi:RNA polymerase sigma-70 factor, ECF subfamily